MTGFIAWVGIAISHYRFRRAFDKQDYDKVNLNIRLSCSHLALYLQVICIIVIIGQDVDFIKTGHFDLNRFVITYMGIPVFLAFFIYHKLRYKTKMIPLKKLI